MPAGTFSTIAKNLDIPRRTLPHAIKVLEAAIEGRARVRAHATLRVRDAAGGDRLGFIFGTGLVAQFFEVYDALPDQGMVSAATLVGRLFAGSFTGSELAEKVLRRCHCESTSTPGRSNTRNTAWSCRAFYAT